MERIQNSGVDDEVPASPSPASHAHHYPSSPIPSHPNSLRDDPPRHWEHHHHNKYSRASNTGEHSRSKRASEPSKIKNTCSLYIQTDPLIWRHIDDDSACKKHPFATETNQFCWENIDVSNFLNLHSLGNHEDFCLAYMTGVGRECERRVGRHLREVQDVHGDQRRPVPKHQAVAQHRHHHLRQLQQPRAAQGQPAHPGARDRTQLWIAGTQLCIKGECSGSICLAWNMKECFLSSSPTRVGDGVTAVVDRRRLCQLACQTGPSPDSCRSTADFAERVGLPAGGISLRPGSPCDNFQCRAVDAEGPLVRLKNLLLNKATLRTLQEWVTAHWWAVVIGGVALIVCMGAFVKCCALTK
ncbi:unnamed protein product, partial [Leptidea sinapis]